ncbi:DUF6113 family protein [Streptomyces sp. DSM 42041]|uniref:DUF6113 family protein n=1 Tax=Streptomyces hazeniae TaxID=3075538 RepID=A0ABU2NNE6_9ACTN|nr:DUF6113 family protein [Streptomyces sp. DSM 42041]MDT0377977.1 DUF6113 family protein [Streptomyces sp. DSM 42041]
MSTGGAGATGHPGEGALTRPGPVRWAAYALLFVLGALVGTAGALVQGGWSPGGLLLALAGAAGAFGGGAKLTRTKVGAMVPAAGWLVAAMLLTSSRAEGDFLFGTGFSSYAYLFGGMLVALLCATISLPAPPRRPTERRGARQS